MHRANLQPGVPGASAFHPRQLAFPGVESSPSDQVVVLMTNGHSPHYVRLGTPEAHGQDDGTYAVTVPLVAEDPAMLGEWTPLLEREISSSSPFLTLSGSSLQFAAASRDEVGTKIEQVAGVVSSVNDAYTDSLVERNEAAAREEIDDEEGPAGQWRADRQHTDDYRTNPKP